MSHPTSSSFGPSLSLPHAGQATAAREAEFALEAYGERAGASRQIARGSALSVEQAIANAARSTSVEFDYLVAQAQVESAMNPQARARTSSASGLFQFIESTWLNTMKRHGDRFGLGDVAAQINVTSGGSAYVADPSERATILALRNDPEIASLMAAGLAEDNRAHLMPILGRQPESSELYLAHFLGAGGAGRFLSAMQSDPGQSAAHLFRRPAAANRAVFFEPGGRPRSLAGVMNYLGAKMDRALAQAPSMPAYGNAGDFTARVASFSPQYPTPRDTGVPYLITAPEVLNASQPPLVTNASPLSPPVTRSRSMSGVLSESFITSGASELASPNSARRIQQAYERLRALGF